MDLERPGGLALWEDTARACFAEPLARRAADAKHSVGVKSAGARKNARRYAPFSDDERRFLFRRRRRFDAGIAEAWTAFVREASRCALAAMPA